MVFMFKHQATSLSLLNSFLLLDCLLLYTYEILSSAKHIQTIISKVDCDRNLEFSRRPFFGFFALTTRVGI